MRSSLSRNFLVEVGATSVAITLLSALAAFFVFQAQLARRQVSSLSEYVQERTENLNTRFSELSVLQQTAVEALQRRMQRMDAAQARQALDAELPLQPDGTRRSHPRAFEGVAEPGQPLVTYGMGAFVARGGALTDLEARTLASAFGVVSAFGQAAHGTDDNFYFFTPHNRLIMFGPNRPDHLTFYRRTAPADLDFSHEEMTQLILRGAGEGSGGRTACTSLQRLLQDNAGPRVGTACVTPVYDGGRLLGAFGSTVNLASFFSDATRVAFPGASVLIVRGDGALLADAGASSPAGLSEREVAERSRKLGLAALVRQVRTAGGDHGVTLTASGDRIVAYGRLEGPGWYYIATYPTAALAGLAAGSAWVVLALGLGASAVQTALMLRRARRSLVEPLQALARSCEGDAAVVGGRLQQRRDEIGVLARALAAERDRADQLLAGLEERVQERTAALEKANAEKSRFLANMSHELRTPLNGVIAVSETLAREQVSARNTELAELIVSSGRLLEQVLTDILDFSKIEAGEMRLESRPFDLKPAISRVAELHRASADAKGVRLVWSIAPEAEGCYLGDAVRMTQVLSNLLSNAVKFTADGEVALKVERSAEGLRLQVADTGVGFDEAVKARLFHRFEQADVSIRRRFGGTGLGLAICRSLTELMGGSIDATSRPGKGSTFTMVLPLPTAELARPQDQAQDGDLSGLDAVRILLAEDHPTNQRVVRLILESAGVELTVVDNGALALEACARQAFDVILMDMQMPEMDGLTATSLIRAREQAEGALRTPIVMLTANALDDHVRASLAAGVDVHLSKPLRATELLDTVARLIGAAEPDAADAPQSAAA